MKYKTGLDDFEKALGLDKSQVTRINNAIQKSYTDLPREDFNIDEINGLVAPYIKTMEEAFYAAHVIQSEVNDAIYSYLSKRN